ncbi:MAG TPA: hypothetical protein VGF59_11205, partial [Bryobacteraceae bacterium]
GAGIQAVRMGKAELVAQIVLTALFVQAILATVMLGFGMNAVFSDVELRRYPLGAVDRFVARHLIGILDPFWFLVFILEVGLFLGIYFAGTIGFWLGFLALLLLFVTNYLAARAVGIIIDRLMQGRSGPMIMLALILSLSLLPSALVPVFQKNPALVHQLKQVMGYTPTFGAAAAMTLTALGPAFFGLGMVAVWVIGLGAFLVWMEKRPARTRQATSAKTSWQSPYDRVANWFGPEDAPLVSNWLRFYMRNTRCRTILLLTLPLAGFLTFNFGRQGSNPQKFFVAAIGSFAMVPFMGTSRIAVNQFGYVGGAFRRYFLFPVEPADTLRTGSYASMLLGGALIPIALLVWLILSPLPFDARQLLTLIGSAVTSLFLFHALGLWCTIYGPRKGNYYSSMGNDLSALGNVIVIGGVFTAIFAPQLLAKVAPFFVQPSSWWIYVAAALPALGFYLYSLRAVGVLFVKNRERLLAVVEGRA